MATAGDAHLGGEDFDNKLVEYCAADFLKEKKSTLETTQGLSETSKNSS